MAEFQQGFINNPNLAASLLLAANTNKRGDVSPSANEPYGVSTGGVGNWDYQTSNASNKLGPLGQDLPNRAIAWDSYGRPYYGDGWDGWYAQTRGNFEDIWHGRTNDPTPQEIQKQADEGIEQSFTDEFGTNQGSMLFGAWARVTDNVKKNGEISVIGQLGRSVNGVVKSVLNAADRLGKFGGEIGGAGLKTISDVAEQSRLPEFGLVQVLGDLTGWDKKSWFRVLEQIDPIHIGWDAVRSIESSITQQISPDEAFEKLTDAITGRKVAMSSLIDETLMQNYLSRLEQGENPSLLAIEMQDPIAQLAGEVFFDPLNLLN
ncbi:hypothetical protein LCGC14_1666590, partial [marine sediment metagenome]